ncbi:MAG: NifB/NifX family molybdenum-iron cluster-binding protein [Desulfofustis sp.]|nr:NifB/NifX family molybdenum-iron cluster-binding protein [Desulfofustis sp.]
MKIAMTVWGNRVSPVFDSAQTILLAEIKDQTVIWEQREFIAGQIPTRLARMLVDKGIDTLICGAISEQPAGIIEASGIKLISFVSGNAAKLLEACATGTLNDEFKMPGCRPACCQRRPGQAGKTTDCEHGENR